MRLTYMSDCEEIQDFAKRAATWFSENSEGSAFSDKGLTPGCFLALRWGLGEDCVAVLKLDEVFEPIIYGQLIKIKKED